MKLFIAQVTNMMQRHTFKLSRSADLVRFGQERLAGGWEDGPQQLKGLEWGSEVKFNVQVTDTMDIRDKWGIVIGIEPGMGFEE